MVWPSFDFKVKDVKHRRFWLLVAVIITVYCSKCLSYPVSSLPSPGLAVPAPEIVCSEYNLMGLYSENNIVTQ